jgi:hypothetical protein
MDDEFNEYNDQDATDCANGDYNVWEENELAREMSGEMEDQLLDMEMEDRIGGTGCEDFGDCYSE